MTVDMEFIDKILDILGIRRVILDKPLTLLGQDCGKVLDIINASRDFGWEEDMDRGCAIPGMTRRIEMFMSASGRR